MINQINLLGRVGKDPEFRALDGGKAVANVTLATTDKYNGEEKTEWHNLTLWAKQAELARDYVKKGDLIHVIGKVQYETYQVEGVTKYTTRIVVRNMTFVQKGKNHDAMKEELSSLPKQNGHPAQNEDATGDLPF